MTTKRIFIDPGHGGRDPGAIHPSGKPCESEITLAAASLLGQVLRFLGHDVMFTPAAGLPNSETIRAGERARFANHNGGALFVSIHCNASESHEGHGSEAWYYSQKTLATDMAKAISLGDKGRNRGAKESDKLSVLTGTDMPAVLVELAFIDNNPDKDWLLKNWPAQVGAMAIVIDKWMGARS
jgi:N-acetylmuramoyl-L-alanine amidase